MNFTTFDDACSYIESQVNLAKSMNYTNRTYRLDRMHALLDHFSHPEEDFTSIHIAGSKGKGSTALFIAKGLQSAGFRCGLYSSPHVETYRERFTLSGTFFDDHFLLETANFMLENVRSFSFQGAWGDSSPTTFELLTLLGFLLFSRSGCTHAVIETGLGGRLDATNTVVPALSVITPIELEHTAVLGDTLELIAAEKAGIIKEGVPVLVSYQKPEAMEVFERTAHQRNSRLYTISSHIERISSSTTKIGEETEVFWSDGTSSPFVLSMRGRFQSENAALAIIALQVLSYFDPAHTIPAISKAVLPGRMELIRENPAIYIDGAHTKESLRRVIDSFREIHPEGGVLLFGAVEGKDHLHMVETALARFDTIIVSTPGTFKRSDPKALFELLQRKSDGERHRIELHPDTDDALDAAVRLSLERGSCILAAGSFYLAAEIRKAVCYTQNRRTQDHD